VYRGKAGNQLIIDYDDYDEAMLQFHEGVGADGEYLYSIELPAERAGQIKRFNADDEVVSWRYERDSEARHQASLTRFYHGAR
jgi:hypothetical protein